MTDWKNHGPDRCSYGRCRREPASSWLPEATTVNPRTTLHACDRHEHLLTAAAHDRRTIEEVPNPKQFFGRAMQLTFALFLALFSFAVPSRAQDVRADIREQIVELQGRVKRIEGLAAGARRELAAILRQLEQEPEPPADPPPSPPPVADVTIPDIPVAPTSWDWGVTSNSVVRPSGEIAYEGSQPLKWLDNAGELEGHTIRVEGSHSVLSLDGDADGRLKGVQFVGSAGASIAGVKIGTARGGVEDISFFNIKFRNKRNSKAAFRTLDAHGPDLQAHGMIGIHNCTFEGMPDAYVWRVAQVDQPGIQPGLNNDGTPRGPCAAAKWWIEGKTAASWFLTNLVFPVSQEHAGYFHYAQEFYAIDILGYATGGTEFQFANRAGKESDDHGPYWFGNPDQPPAGSVGPLVLLRCTHLDKDLGFRDASSFSIFGYLNNVYVIDCHVDGAGGAFVHVADPGKGAWLLDGTSYAQGGNELPGMGYVTPSLTIRNLVVTGPAAHDRTQVAIGGVERVEVGAFLIESTRPHFVFGKPITNRSDLGANGSVRFLDQASLKGAGRIGRWDKKIARFRDFSAQELAELVGH